MGANTPLSQQATGSQLGGLPFTIDINSLSEVGKYMRSKDSERVEQFNSEVKKWANDVSGKLKSNVRSLVKKDVSLSGSIKPKIYFDRKYGKEVNRVGFSFRREGIYIHRGAGKGQGGYKGSKWTDKYGTLKKTNPASFYKMATGNRHPVDWFNSTIRQELENLADIVANYSADLQIDATRIFIAD
jgi:hypothetical protein